MPTRTVRRRLATGYRIRNKVAIFGGGHHTVGPEVWLLLCWYNDVYVNRLAGSVWLEYGPALSYEDWEDGKRVAIDEAFCTGLDYKPKSRNIKESP